MEGTPNTTAARAELVLDKLLLQLCSNIFVIIFTCATQKALTLNIIDPIYLNMQREMLFEY